MSYSLFFLAFFFYLAFNQIIPVTDPVESNYALTAKEMVLSGNWLSPQIYGQFWYDKPILIYWLIAGSFSLFGINDFAARLPAALFGAASVVLLFRFITLLYGSTRQALWGSLVLATSLEFWMISKLILTDGVMFFFTSLSLGWLYLAFQGRGRSCYVLAYGAAAFAVLTKGPVGIVLPGLIALLFIALLRNINYLKKLYLLHGFCLMALIAGPWYYAMYTVHGPEFVDTFLGLHNYMRATVSEHPKDNVFYYYLILVPLSLLPWSGLLFPALWRAIKQAGERELFLLVWFFGFIVFYSFMATKYLTYVFPAIFPAAVLISVYLEKLYTASVAAANWLWLSGPACFMLAIFGASAYFIPIALHKIVTATACTLMVLILVFMQMQKKQTMLIVTVCLTTIVSILFLIPNNLIPLANHRSAKSIVSDLPGDATGAIYGEYQTSAVYYGNVLLPRLILKEEPVNGKNVWAGKYTMPTEMLQTFLQRSEEKGKYILMKEKEEAGFTSLPEATDFQKIQKHDGNILFYRQ